MRTSITSGLAATIFAAAAGAQSPEPNGTALSIQPLSAIFSVYAAEVEHVIGRSATLGVAGSYWKHGDSEDGTRYTSGDVRLRYYPGGHPLRGFSLGGQLGYASLSDVDVEGFLFGPTTVVRSKAHGPAAGVALDYSWLLGETRSYYLGLGVGAKKIFASAADAGRAKLAYPTARISVGYAF